MVLGLLKNDSWSALVVNGFLMGYELHSRGDPGADLIYDAGSKISGISTGEWARKNSSGVLKAMPAFIPNPLNP